MGGTNSGYMRDKDTLKRLTKNWESISQLGYREYTAQDAYNRIYPPPNGNPEEPNLYEDLVWDFSEFNEFHDEIVYDLIDFSDSKNMNNYLNEHITDINNGNGWTKTRDLIYDNTKAKNFSTFLTTFGSNNYNKFQISSQSSQFFNINSGKLTSVDSQKVNEVAMIMYILMDWKYK